MSPTRSPCSDAVWIITGQTVTMDSGLVVQ